MALHLDTVLDNLDGYGGDRRQQSLRQIGEILPFVLANYRVEERLLRSSERRCDAMFPDDRGPGWTNRLPA